MATARDVGVVEIWIAKVFGLAALMTRWSAASS
jgi:hypothetical protein